MTLEFSISTKKEIVTNQKAAVSRGSFNCTHLGHLQIKVKVTKLSKTKNRAFYN